MKHIVYSDGAICKGEAAYACFYARVTDVVVELRASFGRLKTGNITSQRAEVIGAAAALRLMLDAGVTDGKLVSDSKYVVDAIGPRNNLGAWYAQNRLAKDNFPHSDAWCAIRQIRKKFDRLEVEWCPGHEGVLLNECCDIAARHCATKIVDRAYSRSIVIPVTGIENGLLHVITEINRYSETWNASCTN
jgi:ribonuclease HI